MAGKKQAPAKFERFEGEEADATAWDEDGVEVDESGKPIEEPAGPLRDWRDVEKYREQRDLLHRIEDDYGLDEIVDPPNALPVRPKRKHR